MGQVSSPEGAIVLIDGVKQAVLGGAPITPRLEREVQDALSALRACGDTHNVARGERVSAALFTLLQARRNGRPNLHASQLLKLARV